MAIRPLALVGLLVVALAGRTAWGGASPGSMGEQRLEFTRPQMGVPFRIVVYAGDEAAAQRAVAAAYARVEALNAVFSDYDPDSEISRLCRDTPPGVAVSVSRDLGFLVGRSQAFAERTDGAFDITVGPMVNLWRRARRHRELPPEHLLQEARARSGWRHLRWDRRSGQITFGVAGMRLDFGAIAKGYAADEALRVLREAGFPRALVAAAGDVTAGEAPPGSPGWRVEIGQTDVTNAPPPRSILLRHASAATSGDIFQRLEIGGRRYSHILDPRTGIGLTDHSLVTVIAADGTTADSLATAVSVLGPEKGLRLVERTRGAAALILTAPDGTVRDFRSRRLKRWLESDDQRARSTTR